MPKIIGGSLEEHRERTRGKIFSALEELLEQDAFERITFSRIAAVAQVGRTAMYNHFPDKEALLVEYAMHQTAGFVDSLREELSRASTPPEAIRIYVRHQLRLHITFHMPGRGKGASLDPDTARRLREHVVVIENVLRGILRDGMARGDFRPDLDIDQTVRILNSLLVNQAGSRSIEDEALEAFILSGLGAGFGAAAA
ncbi:TetR/AcrR family transcriptional regulator [Brachybacterium hainanense]|uniref:TetR/AcrR family transcriptional regulator n=1 Tax=Brachybacterium hainanense TaxID=1541174 RepID=A0ABV6RAI6_9MICO